MLLSKSLNRLHLCMVIVVATNMFVCLMPGVPVQYCTVSSLELLIMLYCGYLGAIHIGLPEGAIIALLVS